MDIELTPNETGVSVEVTIEQLYSEICEQGILEHGDPHYYLASLALEYLDNGDSIEDCLVQFILHSDQIELNDEEVQQIVEMLE